MFLPLFFVFFSAVGRSQNARVAPAGALRQEGHQPKVMADWVPLPFLLERERSVGRCGRDFWCLGVFCIRYDLIQIEGAIHEPTFKYRVSVGDLVAVGSGQSKKKAKHAAAKAVLDKMCGFNGHQVRLSRFFSSFVAVLYRVFTEFCWRFLECYAAPKGCVAGLDRVLPSFHLAFYRILWGFNEFERVSPGVTGFYRVLLFFYWMLCRSERICGFNGRQVLTEFYRVFI